MNPAMSPAARSLLKSLLQPLTQYRGKRVLVAVSGGADSVGLLRALLYAEALPVVAHLDHALRSDSDEDAQWVQTLAAELDVPCLLQRVEVGRIAQQRSWNLEEAARRVRYQFLHRVAKQQKLGVILTAHTRRDQAETVLINLLRGEAVLRGIAAERGAVQRPWLTISRAEIEAFLGQLGQAWREDSSNADTRFTRAWLRLEVMPILEARYPKIEQGLERVARWQNQDDQALTTLAKQFSSHTPLHTQDVAVLRRYVRHELQARRLTFRAEHLENLVQALREQRTFYQSLPEQRQLGVSGGKILSEVWKYSEPDFDWPATWKLRTKQAGDTIELPAGRRKLSDVLIDARVPREHRDEMLVLVESVSVEPVLSEGMDGTETRVQWLGLTPPLWARGAREKVGASPDPLEVGMKEALRLAKQAAQQEEVPIGAVVLRGHEIIGRGYNTCRHHRDMTKHAELAALTEAAQTRQQPYLDDCTLVVTLEPCPMCLGAAIEARVGRIAYGASNTKAGALGGVTDLLASSWTHRPEVVAGFWARECGKLLSRWFQELRGAENLPRDQQTN